MTVTTRMRAKSCVVAVDGAISRSEGEALRSTVLEAMVDVPPAVILDLASATVAESSSLAVLLLLADDAAMWPETQLVLAGPGPAMLRHLDGLGVTERLYVWSSVEAAIAGSRDPPGVRLTRLRLPPTTEAPRVCRGFVMRQCRDLRDQVRVNVLLAASELVTNAVVHAATDIEVRVSRLGPRLRIAVRDESPIMPKMLDPTPESLHGRGLHIVRMVVFELRGQRRGADGEGRLGDLPGGARGMMTDRRTAWDRDSGTRRTCDAATLAVGAAGGSKLEVLVVSTEERQVCVTPAGGLLTNEALSVRFW